MGGGCDHETNANTSPAPKRGEVASAGVQDTPNGSKASGPRPKRGSGPKRGMLEPPQRDVSLRMISNCHPA
ncbi:hypothetical protein L0F63_007057 [Massospora cicadina]|nr:hypothetical protein L0F63_007057 [Massospora cicadina]